MTMEEMFETHGGYTELVDGEERHVTSDERGRSVVGPRRHGKLGWFRRRHAPTRATAQDVEVVTGEIPSVEVAEPRASRWATFKWAALTRFYDPQWHKAVQHLGVDIMIWSMGMSVAAVFVKGAWWVVTL